MGASPSNSASALHRCCPQRSYPRGVAPRTPLHALSLAASPARSGRVARSLCSLAPWNDRRVHETAFSIVRSGRLQPAYVGPPDQPPLKLRRSAKALAKAEGGHYFKMKGAPVSSAHVGGKRRGRPDAGCRGEQRQELPAPAHRRGEERQVIRLRAAAEPLARARQD